MIFEPYPGVRLKFWAAAAAAAAAADAAAAAGGRSSRRSEAAENMKHVMLIDVKTILLSILSHFIVLFMPSTVFYNTRVYKINKICKTR